MAMDMEKAYSVPFSWATSFLANLDDEQEFDRLFGLLAAGGVIMMGPESVMHLRKVAWVTDKFGVTWQLVWE
jgi:predicted 3-demethylubiquinone-9 3-methyltransferase (glyoxalase superfamily)